MLLHERPLGVLTLLRRHAGTPVRGRRASRPGPRGLRGARPRAPVSEPPHVDDVATRAQSVIAAKATLEIAKGMVAQYTGATIGEAARLLITYASAGSGSPRPLGPWSRAI
ncbi:hypothetical protein ABTY98_20310 [Streptomyces sp. NPDC096040]|uniref:hypothetical protein n=1 Tax=Streptomyces sp. NPDC096040 TaxID=3155541 RepID=UPI0033225336